MTATPKRELNPDSTIREQFRIGAAKAYGRLIWKEVHSKKSKGTSDRAVADLAGFDCSVPSKGRKHGDMSFQNLVVLMAALDMSPRHLPELPCQHELARSGYLEALQFVRTAEFNDASTFELWPEDYECLMLAYKNVAYQVGSEKDRRAIAPQIVASVGKRAHLRAKEAGGAYDYVEQLHVQWTNSWNRCVIIIKATVGWARLVSP